MSLDTQAITKIARLARLRVEEGEKEFYAQQISGILQWVEQLNEVNTDNVPQMVSVVELALPRRKDEVTDGHQPEAILKNAPNADHGCFAVPKVIE
ncbi:MAG: Asp-tRNA(Asn)/Glu-tRNA(Gln) amidotransferase subunit GatC [Alphaproteobacteria bacterium]|nr:Asp-tRNA(Asn)/Glu-tRNA(Gln) amidotransferase subunit GatC [Alphaproteobacteria bacterium]